MTPAEREQVVDLLRAAADYSMTVDDGGALTITAMTAFGIAGLSRLWRKALLADADARMEGVERPWSWLEAARRVEEGWEP